MVALAFAGRTGVRLDAVLGTRVFNASFEANLSHSGPRHSARSKT